MLNSLAITRLLAPAFIAERQHIDEIVDKFRKTLDQHMD